jgi:hypothetical protein
MHIAFSLLTAQVLGSIATIVARAVAPDNVGPGNVFPDFSFYRPGDPLDVFQKAWFYVGLFCQILICIGFFLFFRKVLPPTHTLSLSGTTCEAVSGTETLGTGQVCNIFRRTLGLTIDFTCLWMLLPFVCFYFLSLLDTFRTCIVFYWLISLSTLFSSG